MANSKEGSCTAAGADLTLMPFFLSSLTSSEMSC